jgi:hypothetical protein
MRSVMTRRIENKRIEYFVITIETIILAVIIIFSGSGCSFVDNSDSLELLSPSNLQAVFSEGVIHLSWEDNNTKEEGFSIEKLSSESGSYIEIAQVNADTGTYSDTWWTYEDQLFYRIRAMASDLYSDYSNTADIASPDFNPFSIRCGGSGDDRGYCISKISQCGYLICGITSSSDGDITDSRGGWDALITKFKYSGEVEWIKNIGGAGDEHISMNMETPDGNYILCGNTKSSNSYDVQDTNNGGNDILVILMDPDGNIEWANCIGGSGTDFGTACDVTKDANGLFDGYIIGGKTSSNNGDFSGKNGGSDAAVVKLGINGNIEWTNCIGGAIEDHCASIIQTDDIGYIIAGWTYSHASGDITDDNNSFGGASDFLVVKLDLRGDIEWQQCYGGGSDEKCYSIQQTSDGGYIAGGTSFSDNDGDVPGNNGFNDAWIVKLNAGGGIEWTKCIGGSGNDYCYSIVQTKEPGYVFFGKTESANTVSANLDFSGNNGLADAWLVKLDSNGNFISHILIGGSDNDTGYDVQEVSAGIYALTGYTNSADGDFINSNGDNDSFIIGMEF